jgi:hypothetical protein
MNYRRVKQGTGWGWNPVGGRRVKEGCGSRVNIIELLYIHV